MINFIDTERSNTMNRIVIALVTLIGFSGVAFAEPTLNLGGETGRASFSKVEATSYIASQVQGDDRYQVFNP
jgi:hypothetical protein